MNMVRPRQVEGIIGNPDLSAWPDLFGFCWALVIWAFVYAVSYAAR
jgi:hypothetical protein